MNVFEKAYGWMKLVAGAWIGAGALVLACSAFYGHDLKQTATRYMREIVTSGESAKSTVEQNAKEASSQINSTAGTASRQIQGASESVRRQVTGIQTQVESASKLVPKINAMEAQVGQNQRQTSELQRLYATSDALAGKLVKQALEQHRQMVYNLQRLPTDTYYISDMGNTTTLFFLLPETPLRNSLQLHFGQIPAAPASVFIHHNLVAVFTPSSRAALLSQFISVSYFADSTDQKRFGSVTVSKEPCCVALLHYDSGRLQVPGLRADRQATEWLDSINDAFVGGLLPREDQ